MTVISVAETTLTLVPFFLPNRTAVAPVKFLPWMVTFVPPLWVPLAG